MKKKINGVGKGGIICLFINSALALVFSILYLIGGAMFFDIFVDLRYLSTFLTMMAVLSAIIPVLIIVFGSLAIAKGSNGFKITCGVLGLFSIFYGWYYVIPAILGLVGGILTLCGRVIENYADRTPNIPQIN